MAENEINRSPADQALETRITMALERAPQTTIPYGFAARVAGQLPARHRSIFKQRHYGFLAAQACLVFSWALMAVFAHRSAAGSLYSVAIESMLCLQFVLLTFWFLVRSAGYTWPGGS